MATKAGKLQIALLCFIHIFYILKSSKSKIFYYGYTADLIKRLKDHNKGLSLATKPHIPWKLVWYCAFPTEKQAKDFELYLKSGSGKAFAYKRLVALEKDTVRAEKGIPKLLRRIPCPAA